MSKSAAFRLTAMLVAALFFAGCSSLDDYLNKVGTVNLYVKGSEAIGNLRDFRTLEIEFIDFQLKDEKFGPSENPSTKEVGQIIDLANTRADARIYQVKYEMGRYNMTTMRLKVLSAVLKDGTKVPVAVPTEPYPGVYTADPKGIMIISVPRAKDFHARITFVVYKNTPEMDGPDGEYFLSWDPVNTGRF